MRRIGANQNLINNQHLLVTFKLSLRKCSDIKISISNQILKENFSLNRIVTKLKKNLII